ncbi:MAG: hypothetical protein AB1393_11545 [Candidatus Edwardsbacteria bacterium]
MITAITDLIPSFLLTYPPRRTASERLSKDAERAKPVRCAGSEALGRRPTGETLGQGAVRTGRGKKWRGPLFGVKFYN